jgi:hypothetical protein
VVHHPGRRSGTEYATPIVGTEVAVAEAKPALRRVGGSGRFPAFLQLDRA